MKIARFSILLVLLLSVPQFLQAYAFQGDSIQLQVLVFEQVQKDKKKLISLGAVIRYKRQDAPKVWHKGTLEAIGADHMVVGGQTVAYSDCLIIAGRVRSERDIIGGTAIGAGGAAFLFGTALLGNLLLGGGFLLGGAAALITGVVLITRAQRFHLGKGWTVRGGTLSYRR